MWALDFNVDPLSPVVVQVEDGMTKVIDEIVLRNASTKEACEQFVERYGKHPMPVEIFGDASGYQHRTTGHSDYEIIKEYLQAYTSLHGDVSDAALESSVRERVNLVNGRLRSAAGKMRVLVDEKCKELIQDFEQVAYRDGSAQIDKDRDRYAYAYLGCSGLSTVRGIQASAEGRGEAEEIGSMMETINREHPEYAARKAMWRQYKDLYTGGEQLRQSRRGVPGATAQGAARVYQERLHRVFYENYIGSIIDWYAATLMHRAPSLLIDGSDTGAKVSSASSRITAILRAPA